MAELVSQRELPSSPVEQLSGSDIETYYWDPSGELDVSESITLPTAKVYQYDPGNAASPSAYTDVTSTVLLAGSPFIGVGAHANQIGVTVQNLVPQKEYRVELGFTASANHKPERFFRIMCQL